MELKRLKLVFEDYYKNNNLQKWLDDNQFIIEIDEFILRNAIERNKTVEEEIKKFNSSTSLAINYFQMLAKSPGVKPEYEVDLGLPLKKKVGRGHPAMLDVKYECNSTIHYVESKFLEPYYSNTHKISSSYLKEENYYDSDTASHWVKFFNSIKCKYLDINQMIKHLLAISNIHKDETVVLENYIWKPSDTFLCCIKSKRSLSFFKKRLETIASEMASAEKSINEFITKQLKCKNIKVEFKFYNDILEEISSHPKYDEFTKKYML